MSPPGFAASFAPVHTPQKICPQDGSQEEDSFQMRKTSNKIDSNAAGQIKGPSYQIRQEQYKEKNIWHLGTYYSKKTKWIKGTQQRSEQSGRWGCLTLKESISQEFRKTRKTLPIHRHTLTKYQSWKAGFAPFQRLLECSLKPELLQTMEKQKPQEQQQKTNLYKRIKT